MASDEQSIRLDTEALVVLAHPLRSRLLSTLRLHGPATATELAADLGTNTGATSYHLRKLEGVGLVEDTGEGQGKRRIWSPTTRSHSYVPSDFREDPDAGAALDWLSRHYLQLMFERMNTWFDAQPVWPPEWRDACGLSDDGVLVTAEQAARMVEDIGEVVRRYREAGVGEESARRVMVWSALAPLNLEEPPT